MRDRRTRPKRIPQHQERLGRVAITGAIMSTQSSVHFYLNWAKERIDEMKAALGVTAPERWRWIRGLQDSNL